MDYIETNRLILRPMQLSDYSDFYQYISDAEVCKFEPYQPMNAIEAYNELLNRSKNADYIGVVLKENNKLIGNIYLSNREFNSKEIGFVFNQKYWHHGYAKEACLAIIDICFNNGVHRIYGQCDPDNPNSYHLFEALNFKKEAHLRKNVYFQTDELHRPIWKDTFIYGMLKDDIGIF